MTRATLFTSFGVRGHRGISPNESVDFISRSGPFSCTLYWISPEDSRFLVQKDWKEENNYNRISCDYAMNFSHLLPDRSFPKWILSRPEDVVMTRWRTRRNGPRSDFFQPLHLLNNATYSDIYGCYSFPL